MSKTCNGCEGSHDENLTSVPYIVYESEVAKNERREKRFWIALFVCIGLLFVSNIAWLMYESIYETVNYSYEQDGHGNNIIGDNNGGYYNEPEAESSGEETQIR